MKKFLIGMLVILSVLMVSCQSTEEDTVEKVPDTTGEPIWVNDLTGLDRDNYFYGVGQSDLSSRMAAKFSVAMGRTEIADAINTLAMDILAESATEAGVNGNRKLVDAYSSTVVQISSESIQAEKQATWVSPQGVTYVLMRMPKNEARYLVEQDIMSKLEYNLTGTDEEYEEAVAMLNNNIGKYFPSLN